MISKKRLAALLLAGAMIMGMNTTAFALGDGTETKPATASVKKNFEMAEGLDVPAVTFNFSIEKQTEDAPDATIESVSYSDKDDKGTLSDSGKYIISKNAKIQFKQFPHAGEYLYKVKEVKGDKPADGDKIVFENLPVGTKYEVIEKGVENDGYTPSVTVFENGTSIPKKNGNEKEDLSSLNQGKKNLVGEKTNTVTFVNNHKGNPITGIITNNLPFILLIGGAVFAFGMLAFLKKRRTSER